MYRPPIPLHLRESPLPDSNRRPLPYHGRVGKQETPAQPVKTGACGHPGKPLGLRRRAPLGDAPATHARETIPSRKTVG